jgi:hypothetical protein
MADSKRDSFTKRAREALSGGSSAEQEEDLTDMPNPDSSGAPSSDPSPQMPSLDRFLSDAQSKISEVIDAAERVAKDTHSDARDQASSYLEGRRRDADNLVASRRAELNEITAGIAKRVGDLRAEVDKISMEVGEAIERINVLASSTDEPPPSVAPPELRPVDEVVEEEPAVAEYEEEATEVVEEAPVAEAVEEADGGTQNREHVVLRATQLAVAGTERGEIEETLVREFGIDDAGAIVDEIVGPAA